MTLAAEVGERERARKRRKRELKCIVFISQLPTQKGKRKGWFEFSFYDLTSLWDLCQNGHSLQRKRGSYVGKFNEIQIFYLLFKYRLKSFTNHEESEWSSGLRRVTRNHILETGRRFKSCFRRLVFFRHFPFGCKRGFHQCPFIFCAWQHFKMGKNAKKKQERRERNNGWSHRLVNGGQVNAHPPPPLFSLSLSLSLSEFLSPRFKLVIPMEQGCVERI